MKPFIFIVVFVASATSLHSQELKQLEPSFIHVLDFSKKAQDEWILRDTLLNQLSSGTKSRDELTKKESDLLEKYAEVYEDIWDIVGGACSWYCGGGPKVVTASSFLEPQGANNYEPKNAHDLNYKNAWAEGVPGYGIGEYLLYYFSATSPRITKIIVVNGYVKSQTAWENNARVKKLKMYVNDKPYAILNLKDVIAEQVFTVEPIGNSPDKREKVKFEADWSIKFEILDVYKGLKYDDVVISEIYFDGIDVHCLAKGTEVQMYDTSTKPIEDLIIGDLVSCFDTETQMIKPAKILKLEKVAHEGLVTYRFESGNSITATQDHPFIMEGKGWGSLQPEQSKRYKGFEGIQIIRIGDVFLTVNGTDKLIRIDYLNGKQETYTISQLSSGNTFIANGLIVGVEKTK